MPDAFAFAASMIATHLPYMLVAVALVVVARRTRRIVERVADDLEQRAGRR